MLRLDPRRKVYPLAVFDREPVVNDTVGAIAVVIVGRSATRTARSYERGTRTFRPGRGPDEVVEQASGQAWHVEEETLVHRAAVAACRGWPGTTRSGSAGSPSTPTRPSTGAETAG